MKLNKMKNKTINNNFYIFYNEMDLLDVQEFDKFLDGIGKEGFERTWDDIEKKRSR
jgi:hypothetical protein